MSKRQKGSPSKTKKAENSSSLSIRSPESDSSAIEESSLSSDFTTSSSSSNFVSIPVRHRKNAGLISMEAFQTGKGCAKTKSWVAKHNEVMDLNESSSSSAYSEISSPNVSSSSEPNTINGSPNQLINSSFGNSPRSGDDMSTLLGNSSLSTTKSPDVLPDTTQSLSAQPASYPIDLRIPRAPRPTYFIPLQSVHQKEADRKDIRVNLEIVYMAGLFHPSDYTGVVSKTIQNLASVMVPKSRSRIFLYPGQTMGDKVGGYSCVRPAHLQISRAQNHPLTAVTVNAEKGKQLMLTHVFSKICDSSNTKHMAEGFYMVYAEFHNKKYEDDRFIESTASTIPYALMQKAKDYVANGIPLFEIVPSNDPRIIPKSKYCTLNDMTDLPIRINDQEPFLMFDPSRPNYRADYPNVKNIADFLRQFPNPPKSYFYDKEELKEEIDKYVARTKISGFEQENEIDVVEIDDESDEDELPCPPESHQSMDLVSNEYEGVDDNEIWGTVNGMDMFIRDARTILDPRMQFTDDLMDGLTEALAELGHDDNIDVMSSRDARYLEGENTELIEVGMTNVTDRLRNNPNLTKLLIPYITGAHWLLIIVDIRTGIFQIFDPIQSQDRQVVVLLDSQLQNFRRLRSNLQLIFQNNDAFAETGSDDWIVGQQHMFIDEIMPQMDSVSCGPIVAGALALLLGVASDEMMMTLEDGYWEGLRALLHEILQPYIRQPATDGE